MVKLTPYHFDPAVDDGEPVRLPDESYERRILLREAFDRIAAGETGGSAPPGLAVALAWAGVTADRPEIARRSTFLGLESPLLTRYLSPGMAVLDVGCGLGHDLEEIAGQVGPTGRLGGVDLAPRMVERARSRLERRGVEADLRVGLAEELPFADRSWDAVTLNCCLGLVPQPQEALAEAARVLRPGGLLLLSDAIAAEDLDPDLRQLLSGWGNGMGEAPSTAQLHRQLRSSGLEVVWQQERLLDADALEAQARQHAEGVDPGRLKRAIRSFVQRLAGRVGVLHLTARHRA